MTYDEVNRPLGLHVRPNSGAYDLTTGAGDFSTLRAVIQPLVPVAK
jgi:hypothetical protein